MKVACKGAGRIRTHNLLRIRETHHLIVLRHQRNKESWVVVSNPALPKAGNQPHTQESSRKMPDN